MYLYIYISYLISCHPLIIIFIHSSSYHHHIHHRNTIIMILTISLPSSYHIIIHLSYHSFIIPSSYNIQHDYHFINNTIIILSSSYHHHIYYTFNHHIIISSTSYCPITTIFISSYHHITILSFNRWIFHSIITIIILSSHHLYHPQTSYIKS